ncbi:MAG: phosphoglucosamine mutase [Methanoregulaceae archaeon]|nr:phosphoglucosamine mutase [Methanoregulaceae archaeon]
MSRRYFGTDGIRGVANVKLTPELAFRLGQGAGRTLENKRVVIGRDTRRSGPMLGAALAAGFCSVGVDVVALGVVPTPTVAQVARRCGYGLGAVISASHNPAPDNGIKLIGPDGGKVPDAQELEIERLMDDTFEDRPEGAAIGLLTSDRADVAHYFDFLLNLVPEGLSGMKIAVDASNGAAYELAPLVLEKLGAEIVVVAAEPDGNNINLECGATHPQRVQELTKSGGCHIGVAFDGDADRAVFSDEQGRLINGDRTIAIWSAYRQSRGELDPATVVGTVMSNGGFGAWLESRGITLERAPVGDKYVSERIRATGARIGGEQSGHIIFPALGPTGDGLATALELFRTIALSGRTASSWYDEFENWPQVLINVTVRERDGWDAQPNVARALQEAAERLGQRGRVNVRPSGTQPMIRVMVEADGYDLRDEVAGLVLSAMETDLDAKVYSRVDLTHALGD